MVDAEQAEVVADEVEHRLDRALAEQRQPFALGPADKAVAMFGGEQRPTGFR